jgi:MFS family permease
MKFLGIKSKLPPNAQGLVQKFLFLSSLQSSFFFISGTFYVLFVIDKVGFIDLGVLVGISFLVQAILDYPSGSLGDWIGQRWILAIAFMSYGLSYGLLAFFADSFFDLMIVYILVAFASSQESGALQSWFDNNYKFVSNQIDSDRTIYQIFQGKISMFIGLLWAFTILIGGLLATLFFRETVFAIQSFGMFVLATLSLIYVKDFPGIQKTEKSIRKYFAIIIEGLQFTFTRSYVFFFVAGVCLSGALWSVWGNMILFPMYYGYTGSDLGAGIFRFLAWINASITAGKAAEISTKLDVKKWIPRIEFIVMVGYFGFFAILIFFLPFQGSINFAAIILALGVFLLLDIFSNISFILRQRLYLDMIPDEIRNSVYSLVPTLTLIISAPVIVIAGNFIGIIGTSVTLVILTLVACVAVALMSVAFRVMPKEIMSTKKV